MKKLLLVGLIASLAVAGQSLIFASASKTIEGDQEAGVVYTAPKVGDADDLEELIALDDEEMEVGVIYSVKAAEIDEETLKALLEMEEAYDEEEVIHAMLSTPAEPILVDKVEEVE